jgi:hypothetical protein
MIYNEIGSGGVKLRGCAKYSENHIYTTIFGVGDILYNIDKARRGVLEKVVIKQIIPINTRFTYGQFKVLYKDTLNALWNERDLVTLGQAQTIAVAYYGQLLEDLQELEAQNNC